MSKRLKKGSMEKTTIIKTCPICGKEFTPYYALVNRQHLCGDKECLREYMKRYQRERYGEQVKLEQKLRFRKKAKPVCKICGKPMIRDADVNARVSNSQMHEECVIRDCVKSILAGNTLTNKQKQRLYQRGLSKGDVERVILEGIFNNDENMRCLRKGI